jgi:hypothetical protein
MIMYSTRLYVKCTLVHCSLYIVPKEKLSFDRKVFIQNSNMQSSDPQVIILYSVSSKIKVTKLQCKWVYSVQNLQKFTEASDIN